MRMKYTFRKSGYEYEWTENTYVRLCSEGVNEAFDLPPSVSEIDVIIQTTRPRHNDYQVIKMSHGFPVLWYDDGEIRDFAVCAESELEDFAKAAGVETLYVSVYA